jgi:hypothetical protein
MTLQPKRRRDEAKESEAGQAKADTNGRAFDVFISYSHDQDGDVASALQAGLQRIAKPWYRLGAMQVFRDRTNLSANPDIRAAINAALSTSDYLLLIGSPSSASSPWVQQELDAWLKNRPAKNILLVLRSGDALWNRGENDFDWTSTTAFSFSLKGRYYDQPFWVDLRKTSAHESLTLSDLRFADAVATLAATIKGVHKDQIIGEEFRQKKRLRQTVLAVIFLLTLLASLAFWQGSYSSP